MAITKEVSIPYPVGLAGFHFSKSIADKYRTFVNQINLPAFVFLNLFGTLTAITNISRIESINNYFKLRLDFYLRMIDQSMYASSPNLPMNVLKRVQADSFKGLRNTIPMPSLVQHLFETNFKPRRNISHFYAPNLSDARISRGIETSGGMTYSLLLRGWRSQPKQSLVNVSEQARQSKSSVRLFRPSLAMTGIAQSVIPFPVGDPINLHGALQVLAMTDLTYGGKKLRERDGYKTTTENLYFHNQRKIEQAVKEIKKIAAETNEAISGKSTSSHYLSEMDIKKHFDINRISERVYQNIERRIRIERERRGI